MTVFVTLILFLITLSCSLSPPPHSPFSFSASFLRGALLSVVYTEDIKWPAFTELLELLLHAEVLLSQRLCGEMRRYQRGGGKRENCRQMIVVSLCPKTTLSL